MFLVFQVNHIIMYSVLLKLMSMSGHVDKLKTVNERSLSVIRSVVRVGT